MDKQKEIELLTNKIETEIEWVSERERERELKIEGQRQI